MEIIYIISWPAFQFPFIWFTASYTLYHHVAYIIWKEQLSDNEIDNYIKKMKGKVLFIGNTSNFYRYVRSKKTYSNYRGIIGVSVLVFLFGYINIVSFINSLAKGDTHSAISTGLSSLIVIVFLFYMRKYSKIKIFI